MLISMELGFSGQTSILGQEAADEGDHRMQNTYLHYLAQKCLALFSKLPVKQTNITSFANQIISTYGRAHL